MKYLIVHARTTYLELMYYQIQMHTSYSTLVINLNLLFDLYQGEYFVKLASFSSWRPEVRHCYERYLLFISKQLARHKAALMERTTHGPVNYVDLMHQ